MKREKKNENLTLMDWNQKMAQWIPTPFTTFDMVNMEKKQFSNNKKNVIYSCLVVCVQFEFCEAAVVVVFQDHDDDDDDYTHVNHHHSLDMNPELE